jgi:hypothetical protein
MQGPEGEALCLYEAVWKDSVHPLSTRIGQLSPFSLV